MFFCFVFKSALNASSVVKRIHSRHQNQDEEETVDSAYTVRQVLNPNSSNEKQISAKSLVLSKTAFFLWPRSLLSWENVSWKGIFGGHLLMLPAQRRANSKGSGGAQLPRFWEFVKVDILQPLCSIFQWQSKVHRKEETINTILWCNLFSCWA